MSDINHRFVQTNGIRMHVAEQGEGPLVILCHGFPEGWYSWRHQLSALAAAGFHAVAPDQRGYGQTDRPTAIEAYDIFHLVGDIVGLVHALGQTQAVVVGHDWGAPVAWHCAMLRPDMFRAVALCSVPYAPRVWDDPRPTMAMRQMAGGRQFYQIYFQEPGKAESELEADVRAALRMLLYSASGDPPPERRWRFLFEPSETLMDTGTQPDVLPAWLTEQDIDHAVGEFTRTGFSGGLNWYRNIDRNWELTSFLRGALLRQPTLFIAGAADAVLLMFQQAYEHLETTVPNLTQRLVLPGAGHWIQQERPDEVNQALLAFLKGLDAEMP